MEKRFRALRIVGSVLKIIAWIVLILGVLGGLVAIVAGMAGGLAGGYRNSPAPNNMFPGVPGLGGVVGGLFFALASVVSGLLSFLFLYGAGEAVYLALAIEENTRETAYYLKCGDSLPRHD